MVKIADSLPFSLKKEVSNSFVATMSWLDVIQLKFKVDIYFFEIWNSSRHEKD